MLFGPWYNFPQNVLVNVTCFWHVLLTNKPIRGCTHTRTHTHREAPFLWCLISKLAQWQMHWDIFPTALYSRKFSKTLNMKTFGNIPELNQRRSSESRQPLKAHAWIPPGSSALLWLVHFSPFPLHNNILSRYCTASQCVDKYKALCE